MSRKKLKDIYDLKQNNVGITAITAYDASFAKYFDELHVDILLIGDSLGEVIKGEKNTHSVTLKEIIYHATAVSKSTKTSYLIADLPKISCKTPNQMIKDSLKLMTESKVNMIKVEFKKSNLKYISNFVKNNIPICCHLGLTPQYISNRNGYRKYGNTKKERDSIVSMACNAEKLGAKIILLECVSEIAVREIKQRVGLPVIGIGCGNKCDGQIVVSYDILGISFNKSPNFISKKYSKIPFFHNRLKKYIRDVKKFS